MQHRVSWTSCFKKLTKSDKLANCGIGLRRSEIECTSRFWKLHHALPEHVRVRTRKGYNLWKRDHWHPSLDFKKLKGGGSNRFLIRIGDHHRAIGQLMGDVVEWVWIGSHEDYNKLM